MHDGDSSEASSSRKQVELLKRKMKEMEHENSQLRLALTGLEGE